jgi:O-acetyl-ADP-ribose deacetylase (regulator of RNase III)
MGLQVAAKLTLGNSSTQLYIAHDSVLHFTGDAIVNAANNGCVGGGGIDGCVNFRGGDDVYDARMALPELDEFGTRCNTGDAKITISGQLPCDKVIHAVGPRFGYNDDHSDNLKRLESAYKASLERAREAGVKTIGFCLLSAGIFRGSCSLSAVILCGLDTIAQNAYSGLETVIVCAFTDEEKEAFSSILQRMPLIGSH